MTSSYLYTKYPRTLLLHLLYTKFTHSMANITEEGNSLEALLKAMEEKDKTIEIKPQVCNLDDEECLTCGS